MAPKIPQKFIGSTAWVDPADSDKVSVNRAILRSPDELVVDFVYDGRRYTATLRRTAGNEFVGKYTTQWNGSPYEGNASCRLFTAPEGIFLFGRWSEDNENYIENYIWWADLNVVKHFADEASQRGV